MNQVMASATQHHDIILFRLSTLGVKFFVMVFGFSIILKGGFTHLTGRMNREDGNLYFIRYLSFAVQLQYVVLVKELLNQGIPA